jgi:hypothetical protein
MALFVGTLIIVGLCCLAMGLGQIIDGKPLSGGCGNKPKGVSRCDTCPKRKTAGDS